MLRRARTTGLLAIVTLAIVIAAVLTHQRSATMAPHSTVGPLLGSLMQRINDTAEVDALHAGAKFSVVLRDGRWVVPEKAGYEASASTVRELIVGVAGLERLEPKTRKTELYPALGLGDPSAADSDSVHFTLKDAGGRELAGLRLGRRRVGKADPGSTEVYVLADGDTQAWLAQGRLPEIRTPLDLIDKRITDIDAARVREVRVTHQDGEQVVISRSDADTAQFALAGMPPGTKVKYDWAIRDIAQIFSGLTLEDVQPTAQPQAAAPEVSVEMHTFDGLVLTLQATRTGKETLARVSARSETPAGDTETPENTDGVSAEAERINATLGGWTYKLPSYRADGLMKKMADLTEPLATSAGDGAAD